MSDQPIRPAATIILTRNLPSGWQVLMGQRGHGAAFMPSKFVFPGGGLDDGDAEVPLAAPLPAQCRMRLANAAPPSPEALAAAAIRELYEETGLTLGRPGAWQRPVPQGWEGFAARGLQPMGHGLRFVFRAITPPGRSRRFDARFFLADAAHVVGDVDDFSAASDELSHLHWLPLGDARALDLPFITEVVLSEIGQILRGDDQAAGVPFFDNSSPTPTFRRIM